MIRESLVGDARMAITAVMRTNPLQYKVRETEGATPHYDLFDRGDNTKRPVWLRVVRAGNAFTSFESEDGTTFKPIGSPITVDGFAKTAYVGLAFCGHGAEGEYNTIVYDNFTVTTP
jgi:hypothetical protein